MYKKFLAILVVLMLVLSSVPVFAESQSEEEQSIVANAEEPVIFRDTITVTADGGRFNIGFATMVFKKNFLEPEKLPATFDVTICVKNGEAGIEIDPSTPGFQKDVNILVDSYNGFLYDEDKGKNIKVKVKKQKIVAEHFSWYKFR